MNTIDTQNTTQNNDEGISKYAEITYLNPNNAKFYKTAGGFLGLKLDDKDYERVNIFRMFPLTYLTKYLSVRDTSDNETGVIADLDVFDDDTKALINAELARRYFVPVITNVSDVKEEFNYTFWDCETTAGMRSFVVFDMNHSLTVLSDRHVQLIDVDGNRYEILDVSKLSPKALKLIEIWL